MDNNLFTGIQVDRVFEKIIAQIRKLIEEGALKPGDRLPSERRLSEIFGCSRASVREAFRVLEMEGILVTKHGEGRFVRPVDDQLVMEYRYNPLDLIERSAILHFLEARESLEPKVAALAAIRATDKDIENMERALEEQFKISDDEEVTRDNLFILAMAEATQNFVFYSMVESYLNMVKKLKTSTRRSKERIEASQKEHRAIFEAIKRRDPEGAAQAVLEHVKNAKQYILKDLNKPESVIVIDRKGSFVTKR